MHAVIGREGQHVIDVCALDALRALASTGARIETVQRRGVDGAAEGEGVFDLIGLIGLLRGALGLTICDAAARIEHDVLQAEEFGTGDDEELVAQLAQLGIARRRTTGGVFAGSRQLIDPFERSLIGHVARCVIAAATCRERKRCARKPDPRAPVHHFRRYPNSAESLPSCETSGAGPPSAAPRETPKKTFRLTFPSFSLLSCA